MSYLKRSWIIFLLLFVYACDSDQPEETTTIESAATLDNIIPSASPRPSRQTTATPTLRATGSASDPSAPQVRPILNAIFVRSGPGEGFDQIGLLYEDETAEVIGTDDFDVWYEIVTDDGTEGWVAASVVELIGEPLTQEEASAPTPRPQTSGDSGTPRLQITINLAYVRNGPGENYSVIENLAEGSTVTVLGYASNGAWYNVQLSSGMRGWIGDTVTEPVGNWTLEDISAAGTIPAPPPTPQNNCDPAYPTVCIPSPPPDLDCRDIEFRNFTVLPPDPHLFDGNQDGVGCGT